MSDDDRAARGRTSSHWDDERRALEGRNRRLSAPRGVPAVPVPVPPAEDATPVFDMIERPAVPAALEAVKRSKRDSNDPASLLDVANVAAEVALLRREMRASAPSAPPEVVALQERVAMLSKVMGALAIAVLGSVLAIGSLIYSRGFTEGGDKVRLEQLEKAVDRLDRDVRALERHASASPAISPDAITSATEGSL